MSKSNADDPGEPPGGDEGPVEPRDREGVAGRSGQGEEDDLDLDDLETMGVDGVVARLRGPEVDDDALFEPTPTRRTRPVWVSLGVIGFAVYLLASMYADFRYWLEPAEPLDLGHASAFVHGGRVPDGYHDRHVVLEGTPDVQHAARLTTKEHFVGYLRIMEGGGQLFAAIPRSKEEPFTNTFEGRYAGRMIRLDRDPAFEWLEQFYAMEKVVRTVDATPAALAAGLRARSDDGLVVDSEEGPLALASSEHVRVVVSQPAVKVQLGTDSVDAEAAERLVASLGRPYRADKGTPAFHAFVVGATAQERDAIAERLAAGLDSPDNTADPRQGVAVFPLTTTYVVPVGDLAIEGDALVFPYEGTGTSPGWVIRGDALEERALEQGRLRVDLSSVHAVRLEKRIVVDPAGYLILVGADPASERMTAILWLVVLGIALANAAGLVLALRRRAR